jgi:hypothetical protein
LSESEVDPVPITTPLNVLDELYLHLGREDEPWTVHVEIRVDGPIERSALETAVREAAARHPLARAQLAPSRGIDLHYAWLIADQLGDIDLREVTCRDREELARASPARTPARTIHFRASILLSYVTSPRSPPPVRSRSVSNADAPGWTTSRAESPPPPESPLREPVIGPDTATRLSPLSPPRLSDLSRCAMTAQRSMMSSWEGSPRR